MHVGGLGGKRGCMKIAKSLFGDIWKSVGCYYKRNPFNQTKIKDYNHTEKP